MPPLPFKENSRSDPFSYPLSEFSILLPITPFSYPPLAPFASRIPNSFLQFINLTLPI